MKVLHTFYAVLFLTAGIIFLQCAPKIRQVKSESAKEFAEAPANLKLNQLQVLGTHNSYAKPVDPQVMAYASKAMEPIMEKMLSNMTPKLRDEYNEYHPNKVSMAEALAYDHPPLTDQLNAGLRSLEIDVFYDPTGGRFKKPASYEFMKKQGVTNLQPFDTVGLEYPGFKVLHIADFDFRTHCTTLEGCLSELKTWSDQHPQHVPIFILLEIKQQGLKIFPNPTEVMPFDSAAMNKLDAEIVRALGRDKIIAPDDVRGQFKTLEEAVLAQNYPTLEASRGKFVFLMLPAIDESMAQWYWAGRPSLEGRMMFVRSTPGTPRSAFLLLDNAIMRQSEIQQRVREGYLVRTRSDIETYEAKINDYTRANAAFSSGAQIISTDFFKSGNTYGTDYMVKMPNGKPAQCNPVNASGSIGFQRDYTVLNSNNIIVDKNFYLLTAIEQSEPVRKIIASEPALYEHLTQKIQIIKQHVADTCTTPTCLLTDFKISSADSLGLMNVLKALYIAHQPALDTLINQHLRPSGNYQRFTNETNLNFWLKSWAQYVVGINYIIDQFGFGLKMRYPHIDSASYNVNSRYYRIVLKDMMGVLEEKTDAMTLFYHPALHVALQLMQANDRDEPARHEPMAQKDNKAAVEQVLKTDWAKYRYAAIVVPGNGPELSHTPLSPVNKMRLDIVAERFRKGWAPFIIVSGGYCYPYKTTHAEAVEMKNYLMDQHGIEAKYIIIDPHARHTTTNFRNANRLMIRYGFPMDKLCVFTTTKSQTDYVMNSLFDKRNERELGYLPYFGKVRISNHDIEYLPSLFCLHLDPFDPLDP